MSRSAPGDVKYPPKLPHAGGSLEFQGEWRRFERVYSRRRAFFLSDEQQASKETSRLFVISRNDDPWEIFGLASRRSYLRRIYEVSGLHFTTLHDACMRGDKHEVKHLLAQPRAGSALARDSSNRLALHHAVIREHHSIIRLLMKQADARLQLHVRDNRGAPPVQYVLEKMYCLALKVSPGATPARQARQLYDSNKRFRKLWKLADRMLRLVEPGLRRLLLPFDVKTRGDAWDAVRGADLSRLQFLFEIHPESTDSLDALGWALLHEACSSESPELRILQFILSRSQSHCARRNTSGATPLHHAAMRGWLEACVLLVDQGTPDEMLDGEELLLALDNRGRTPLHVCLLHAGLESVFSRERRGNAITTARFLAQRCPDALQVVDHDGFTALHYAVCCGDRALVELMIGLGANLFYEVKKPSTRREYGERAAWAPCGSWFERRQERKLKCRQSETSRRDVSLSKEPPAKKIGAFEACERMKKVRAGEVGHPGMTMPMETLWFLVRGKQRMENESRDPLWSTQLLTHEHGEEHPACSTNEQNDPRRLGCRRFGAECTSCPRVDRSFQNEISDLVSVSISPVVLAIRCCRQEYRGLLSERIEIVRVILLAGSAVDDATIDEALLAIRVPRLLSLVLCHLGRGLSHDNILDHFCSVRVHGQSDERRQPLLQRAFEEDPTLIHTSMVPSLFAWKYFDVVERVLERTMSVHGCIDPLLCELSGSIVQFGEGRGPRRLPAIDTAHLDRIVSWMPRWPERVADLGIACINKILVSRFGFRQRADLSLAASVCAISKHKKLDDFLVRWIDRAITWGLRETVRALWTLATASDDLATHFISESSWPLRWGSWIPASTASELVQELVSVILQRHSSPAALAPVGPTESSTGALAMCLVLTCIHDISADVAKEVIRQIQHGNVEQTLRAVLAPKRFGGLRTLEWMVRARRVEVAELLMTELFSTRDQREQLWLGVASAVLVSPSADTSEWRDLLCTTWRHEISADARRRFLSTRAVRVRHPCALVNDLVLLETEKQENGSPHEWIKASGLVHEAARWNAVHLMKSLAQTVGVDAGFWTELVTKSHATDDSTPLELCESLGHWDLAQLFRELAPAQNDISSQSDFRRVGLLRTLLESATHSVDQNVLKIRPNTDPLALLQGNWTAAVAMDHTLALKTFSLHKLPFADGESTRANSLEHLLRTAIRYGSSEALEWLLGPQDVLRDASVPQSCDLLLLAARHSGSVHARMTARLLREPKIDLGRLSGDSHDVTLLHRVACFSEAALACTILDSLLRTKGGDVNVRDGDGFTPVAYAIATGNIATANFLVLEHGARLENEFEGQSTFYYTLQLLPSFSWRFLFQRILFSACDAAFLHCTSDDCACKSFEQETPGDHKKSSTCADVALCSFCGHAKENHTHVPYPPWFRDQYETYLVPAPVADNANEDNEDNDEDDEDETASSRRRLLLAAPLADEAAVESDRGRLDSHDLLHITALRFRSVFEACALPLPAINDPENIEHLDPVFGDQSTGAEATAIAIAQGSCTNLQDADCAPHPPASQPQDASSPVPLASGTSLQRKIEGLPGDASAIDLALLPWFLRRDVAAAMRSDGHFNVAWNITPHALVHTAVVTWLMVSARNVLRHRTLFQLVMTDVFVRWLDATRSATSTASCAIEGCSGRQGATRRPVALDFPDTFIPRGNVDGNMLRSVSQPRPIPLASTPPTNLIGSADANNRVSILQLFVHHWRYARVYQCFRQWKRSAVTTQLALQELETLAETWASVARRERFQALVARQHALENDLQHLI